MWDHVHLQDKAQYLQCGDVPWNQFCVPEAMLKHWTSQGVIKAKDSIQEKNNGVWGENGGG